MRKSKLIVNVLKEKSQRMKASKKNKLTWVALIALYISAPTPAERPYFRVRSRFGFQFGHSNSTSTLFVVCNRGNIYYSITAGSSRQGNYIKSLSLLFLTPRRALSPHQHRTLVCLFWSRNLHCSFTMNLTTARQECFDLLDVSNKWNYSFSNT